MRAVQVFGFHLATIDLRQSSDQHEAVIAELLAMARIEPDYAALDEARKRTVLTRLLNEPRPTISDIENCGSNLSLDSATVATKMTDAIRIALD